MTNTEGTEPTVPQIIDALDAEIADAVEAGEVTEAELGFATTVPTMDGHFDQPQFAFRYLNWLYTKIKTASADVSLAGFSVERQEGIADLVRNGLVSERVYTGGLYDGRRSLKITELGIERLRAAWEAANLVVLG